MTKKRCPFGAGHDESVCKGLPQLLLPKRLNQFLFILSHILQVKGEEGDAYEDSGVAVTSLQIGQVFLQLLFAGDDGVPKVALARAPASLITSDGLGSVIPDCDARTHLVVELDILVKYPDDIRPSMFLLKTEVDLRANLLPYM